jgi:hypothetical protein
MEGEGYARTWEEDMVVEVEDRMQVEEEWAWWVCVQSLWVWRGMEEFSHRDGRLMADL